MVDERHKIILETLKNKGTIKAREIQEMFDIGFDTARRDLRILEEKGLLKRTHGGAIPLLQVGHTIPEFYTHKDIKSVKDNYMKISKRAIKYIKENDVVFLTHASVGYFISLNLPKDINFTVVTQSIVLSEELRKYKNINTFIVGGQISSRGKVQGHLAYDFLSNMHFDLCFICSSAISASFGMSINSPDSVGTTRVIMKNSRKTIGLFPNEKIGRESMFKICPVSDLDILITDWETSEEELIKIEEDGVEVVIVKQ